MIIIDYLRDDLFNQIFKIANLLKTDIAKEDLVAEDISFKINFLEENFEKLLKTLPNSNINGVSDFYRHLFFC